MTHTTHVNGCFPAVVPGSVVPSSVVPDSVAPGSVVPDSVVTGSVAPGSVVPGLVVPDSVVPGSAVPGLVAPGSVVPDSVSPGSVVTGSVVSGSVASALWFSYPWLSCDSVVTGSEDMSSRPTYHIRGHPGRLTRASFLSFRRRRAAAPRSRPLGRQKQPGGSLSGSWSIHLLTIITDQRGLWNSLAAAHVMSRVAVHIMDESIMYCAWGGRSASDESIMCCAWWGGRRRTSPLCAALGGKVGVVLRLPYQPKIEGLHLPGQQRTHRQAVTFV